MTIQAREQNGSKQLTGRLTEVALDYQRMLQQNPRQPEALVGICLVALASGQNDAAIKMARAATTQSPARLSKPPTRLKKLNAHTSRPFAWKA